MQIEIPPFEKPRIALNGGVWQVNNVFMGTAWLGALVFCHNRNIDEGRYGSSDMCKVPPYGSSIERLQTT